MEGTMSFHISVRSGMLWIQESCDLPVSSVVVQPGDYELKHIGVLPTPPAASSELKEKEGLVVAKMSHFYQHEDEHGDE